MRMGLVVGGWDGVLDVAMTAMWRALRECRRNGKACHADRKDWKRWIELGSDRCWRNRRWLGQAYHAVLGWIDYLHILLGKGKRRWKTLRFSSFDTALWYSSRYTSCTIYITHALPRLLLVLSRPPLRPDLGPPPLTTINLMSPPLLPHTLLQTYPRPQPLTPLHRLNIAALDSLGALD